MSLQEYRRKRAFDRTTEPDADAPAAAGRALFVVQLHHASRRHYDFRLQVGDVLRSWAVPKGPSFDPAVKRLAVEVEDHPLAYADFQGEIAKGEYGAGHVALFDRGIWTSSGDADSQLAKGHLRFELHGDKLRGGWHLVRSGKPARQPQWLLFKDEDAFAGPVDADDLLDDVEPPPAPAGRAKAKPGRKAANAAVAGAIKPPAKPGRSKRNWRTAARSLAGAQPGKPPDGAPKVQLASLVKAPPRGTDWLHELKWDGYRIIATIANGKIRLWSRNGLEWTSRLPEIASALSALALRSAVLDGELVAAGGARADFNRLQATLVGREQAPLSLVLFDLLHVDGIDTAGAALAQRKALLAKVLGDPPPAHLAYSSHLPGNGDQALALARENGFEGLLSKRADRPYRAGRSDDWRKTKLLASDDYAVVGYTPGQGSRIGFGALLLARPDPVHGWAYAGRVGSGFADADLRRISALIGTAGRRQASVHVPENDTDLRAARWFAPRFVVEVEDRGRGDSGLLRQASFKTLREDRSVDELTDTDSGSRARQAAATLGKRDGKKQKSSDTRGKEADHRRGQRRAGPDADIDIDTEAGARALAALELSHPDRVVFPDAKVRKRDVAAYYAQVMDRLLPEIAGRPLSVVRCPDGIAKACFFQKHKGPGMDRVDHVRLEESSGGKADYLVVNDAAGLLQLVQLNALEFHPWGSHADRPDLADRIVFDLDPGPGITWPQLRRAARQLRDRLVDVDLVSFLRTTGGKGLHVVVPLQPACAWPLVRSFAQGFAQAMVSADPQHYVAVASKAQRKGRIFIDYLRNGRGATAIASYSLRARAGAPVAVPLAWPELTRVRGSNAYDWRSLPARLRQLRQDPWQEMATLRQDLSRWSGS